MAWLEEICETLRTNDLSQPLPRAFPVLEILRGTMADDPEDAGAQEF